MQICKSNYHCVKSVQIRSFFWSEYGKIRTRENLDTFHALYRPISILPNLSKIYEMYTYFNKFFCKTSVRFGKGYNVQHRLLVMIEKMKEARDKNKICAAVLTDLSKAFDFLRHDLLILKPYIWLVLLQ